ncbi:2Fe-2S iron-sulfur cluster-binding protein [Ilumatobacter coccineus]|uniref:Putative oxidoreductase n=1 Tax=Ilumatobacter coccineus (strain NBRC 103263 / KCTC 29153 / YM16-304) TaxID=1313172 RepID=A0A6C7E920_ILUCY|nr:2Fe-2S iron-sulfur cluster-binding protein [Ilumatobacter coccineus]BAN04154.1 putative oxidoreductase [Ilumatobacter coccineus YM16-304]
MTIDFELDGDSVVVTDDAVSLLDALRDELGVRSPKDGCSPQGQCGCCTVLVDGRPRVACVTPVSRVRGRSVTTVDGLADRDAWARAFCDAGASQCGFCTPGIIARLSVLTPEQLADREAVDKALLAHLCRCTGWQTVREAAVRVARGDAREPLDRDLAAAERRALIEGGAAQTVGAQVALGYGGFSDDEAPDDALVALLGQDGEWVAAETIGAARRLAGKVQGRRTTAAAQWPIELPPGEWARSLQTTWVEPAYLEPDAAWCSPGGQPSSPLGNGGAFGGKSDSSVGSVARRLADQHGRTVRVLFAREDVVRLGAKRPPLAVGVAADGSGTARVARPANVADEETIRHALRSVAPAVDVEFVDLAGPPVSAALRGAVWAEVAAVVASLGESPDTVTSPDGATATAVVDADGRPNVTVDCGDPLDDVVLRSYCIGAVHMALGLVLGESIALDEDGVPLDLTIRSFGVLRATDTPEIDIAIAPSSAGDPVNASDAVFAAALAAAWRQVDHPLQLPTSARLA